MSIWERRAHFIDNLKEEGPFYWQFERADTILLGNFRRRLVEFLIMSKTMLAFGWSFILWSKLYLEDCSSTSSYFWFGRSKPYMFVLSS